MEFHHAQNDISIRGHQFRIILEKAHDALIKKSSPSRLVVLSRAEQEPPERAPLALDAVSVSGNRSDR
jgi:hypothetical protein